MKRLILRVFGATLFVGSLVPSAMASDAESMRSLPVTISEIRVLDNHSAPMSGNQIRVSFELKGAVSEFRADVHEYFPWIVVYRKTPYGGVGTYYNTVREDNRIFGCDSITTRADGKCGLPLGTISAEGFFEPLDGYNVFADKVLNQPPLWMKAYCLLTSMCPASDSTWFEFGLRE